MPHATNLGILAAALASACLLAPGSRAEPDCEPRPVNADGIDVPLTRAERIERMDRALEESLRRFDACQRFEAPDAGNGAAEGMPIDSLAAEGVSGAGSPVPEEDSQKPDSAAARNVEGPADGREVLARRSADDPWARPPPPPPLPETDPAARGDGTAPAALPPAPGGNGALPSDIPPPDNDSALEAQIRRAAMQETDPRLQAELWNEYRRYKELPARPLPEAAGDRKETGDAPDPG